VTRKSKKKPARRESLPPEVAAAYVDMYEGIFFSIMQAMFKATTIEQEFGELETEIRKKTQADLHNIARVASERFVDLANPNPASGSKDQIALWKREAIAYALKHYNHQ